jgi:hypothetical protein
MTDDKKKALQVYALGIFTVLLCIGAAWAHISFKNCADKHGEWSLFSCTLPRQGKTLP